MHVLLDVQLRVPLTQDCLFEVKGDSLIPHSKTKSDLFRYIPSPLESLWPSRKAIVVSKFARYGYVSYSEYISYSFCFVHISTNVNTVSRLYV